MTEFVRTCRYGHGPLQPHVPPEGMTGYHFSAHKMVDPMGSRQIVAMSGVFTFALWTCTTCGYLEMSDDLGPNNG